MHKEVRAVNTQRPEEGTDTEVHLVGSEVTALMSPTALHAALFAGPFSLTCATAGLAQRVTHTGTLRRGPSRTPARQRRGCARWCSSAVLRHRGLLRHGGGRLPPWHTRPAPACTAHTSVCREREKGGGGVDKGMTFIQVMQKTHKEKGMIARFSRVFLSRIWAQATVCTFSRSDRHIFREKPCHL